MGNSPDGEWAGAESVQSELVEPHWQGRGAPRIQADLDAARLSIVETVCLVLNELHWVVPDGIPSLSTLSAGGSDHDIPQSTLAGIAPAPALALSACQPPANRITRATTTWSRLANRDNHLYIAVAGNFSTDHGCSQPWWARSEHNLDKAQTTAMLQISLSSLLSRQAVHVYTAGCTSYGYPILTHLQIQEREPPPAVVDDGGGTSKVSNAPHAEVLRGTVNGRCLGQCIAQNRVCSGAP
jgi:hypothetical protein